jgi:hypothetical protein
VRFESRFQRASALIGTRRLPAGQSFDTNILVFAFVADDLRGQRTESLIAAGVCRRAGPQ